MIKANLQPFIHIVAILLHIFVLFCKITHCDAKVIVFYAAYLHLKEHHALRHENTEKNKGKLVLRSII